MYIYEKFFPVTKVHGYKIISIQRLASSLFLPSPPTIKHQGLGELRGLWTQLLASTVIYKGPWVLPPLLPFTSFWVHKIRQGFLALRNEQRYLFVLFYN